jgi:ferredoxin
VLQELSGIKNAHAERAAREAREAARVETEAAIEAVKAEHRDELERVRAETAGEAMEKLTGVLLDLDLDALTGVAGHAAPPARPAAPPAGETTETPAAAEEPAPPEEEEEDEPVSDEPWLETFRCTSCNECIDINPLVFQYNADKLAQIVDPKAGTYADLVKAAEKCPARCIHPGKPLDPSEPNLDELMKRAEKFN